MKSADGSLVDGTIRGVAKATREERNDRIVVDGVGLLMEGLAADNRQLGVPEFGSLLASGLLWHGADGQRCLLQLKPDPLCGERSHEEARMDDHVNLYCPVHHDVVLFRVPPPTSIQMFVPPKPAECPKCKKRYQQYECISEELRNVWVSDED
ncbi:MAG: hypothetical protein KC616_15465 [Myxococcales bacterium]|nr:hypothetical protein [Myxococcales bacterium]